jgi:hypothetical protein
MQILYSDRKPTTGLGHCVDGEDQSGKLEEYLKKELLMGLEGEREECLLNVYNSISHISSL